MQRNPKIVSANLPSRSESVEALLDAPRFLASVGLSEEDVRDIQTKEIGQGHYARAYILDNGLVLKLTDDPDDAQAADVIRIANEQREYPTGLPHVQDVRRFKHWVHENETEEDAVRQLFAIVYEAVVPMQRKLNAQQRAVQRSIMLEMRNRNIWRVADFNQPYDEDWYTMQELMGMSWLIPIIDEVMEGVKWLHDKGFDVRDLHAGNVGEASGGRFVVFDFGHNSKVFGDDEVRLAENPTLTPNGRMPRVLAAFDECFTVVEKKFPDFGDIELHQDEKAASDNGHGSERQFGYCMDGKPIKIAFAAKTEQLPESNIRGLMAHEFGHALDYRYGRELGKLLGVRLPDGVERRADAIATAVFGRTIKYDSKDVQCVACSGVNKRPRRLGA